MLLAWWLNARREDGALTAVNERLASFVAAMDPSVVGVCLANSNPEPKIESLMKQLAGRLNLADHSEAGTRAQAPDPQTSALGSLTPPQLAQFQAGTERPRKADAEDPAFE